MKDRTKRKGTLTALTAIFILIVIAFLLIAFYSITKYISFLLTALLIIPSVLINFLFLVISSEAPNFKPECSNESVDDDATHDENKRGFLIATKTFFKIIIKKAVEIYKKIIIFYSRAKVYCISILFAIIELAVQLVFWMYASRITSIYTLNYLFVVILLVSFIVLVAIEKYFVHSLVQNEVIKAIIGNLRSTVVILRLALIFVMIASVIKLLGFYDVQKWLVYILMVIFSYSSVFTIISFISVLIKKEIFTEPIITIPIPFAHGASKDLGILAYLEKNTGITMRTLWSIKLIKTIMPYMVVVSAIVLWLFTGIVQVESYQSAAVYRFGVLQNESLSPGLHMTLPWPIDKVEIMDTETVNKITIGYNSVENTDNIWTGIHGANEYKLLLGSGNELVSINIRLEYNISDIIEYLKCSSSPEKLLEVKAYEIVTDKTINSDLETMLSIDRNAFAETLHKELIKRTDEYNMGIEVVGVVLESIHPPTDVASIYQDIVSAEITAEKYILDAEAEAAVKIAGAEKHKDTAISQAKADNYSRVATAKADVAEFVASLNADNTYGNSYRYYKYMNAIGNAYGSSKLVIVGEGVDSSNIYFGSFRSAVLN